MADEQVFHFHGPYREYRAPRKLSFTWEWESLPISGVEGPGNTLVTLKFVPAGKGKVVILTQTGFASQAARQAHEKGRKRCFDGIELLPFLPVRFAGQDRLVVQNVRTKSATGNFIRFRSPMIALQDVRVIDGTGDSVMPDQTIADFRWKNRRNG